MSRSAPLDDFGSQSRHRTFATPARHVGLVEIVVPVYNEQEVLKQSIETLRTHLAERFPVRWRVVIVDNASTDGTWAVASELARSHSDVEARRLDQKGRGLALRTAWGASDADVVSYMDVDLSTNLESFLPLVAPLLSGHSDIAIGTRLARRSNVVRQAKREVLSRGYNALVHLGFGYAFSDAQCGFKAARREVVQDLLRFVEDDGWFFDTELLLLAARNGYRIYEVPVSWIEDLDSRVDLRSTIADDLRGLWRVRRAFWNGHGVVSPADD